ncbi:MAG: hypothetical protein ACREMO_09820 [Gemmatimonadales bacterium]
MLRRAARQVDAEICLLLDASEQLQGLETLTDDPLVRRSLLESWGIHLLRLVDFFHPRTAAPSDAIFAEHYLRNRVKWTRALPRLTPREERRRHALHGQLGELRYERTTTPIRWRGSDQAIVAARVKLFLGQLSAARRRWFPKAGARFRVQDEVLTLL